MAYRQLSIESIAEYLQGIPEMKKVFSSFNKLDIREIGDGNLNYVYLVKNKEKPNVRQSILYDFKNNKDKWVLVIGNEANGISKASRKNIEHFLSIPAIGSGNSLNAAVAGSILIHQLVNYK